MKSQSSKRGSTSASTAAPFTVTLSFIGGRPARVSKQRPAVDHAAVHGHDRAGGVGREIRREEGRHVGDLLGGRSAPERKDRAEFGVAAFVAVTGARLSLHH